MTQAQESEDMYQHIKDESLIIPTVVSHNGSPVSEKEDVAIVLAKIFERVGWKQSRSRKRGFIFAIPFIVLGLFFAFTFGAVAEPDVSGILKAAAFPVILASVGLFIFFKLYKPDMKVVGVEKIYLTSHVTSGNLMFVFDGSAIQEDIGFSYSDLPDEVISDLKKAVDSIEEENGEEKREHSTRAQVAYIQTRLSDQVDIQAKGAIFPSNHPVTNLINRSKDLLQSGSPHGYQSFTGGTSSFEKAYHAFDNINAINERGSTRDDFDKLSLKLREKIQPFVDQIHVPYGKVTRFFDYAKNVEKERWFRGNDISFGEAQVEYSDIGYLSGHHRLEKVKALDKSSLIYPVQAIIDNFERDVKSETDQLYQSQNRQLTNLKSNLEREITRVQSRFERDINRLLTKADVAERKVAAARTTYSNAMIAYDEATSTRTDSKSVAASLSNRANSAIKDSRRAENDIRNFTAEAEQSRRDAEESSLSLEREIQDLKDSLDSQTKQNLDSLNKEISSRRSHIDRIYDARDKQLDKVRDFLEKNLTNEMNAHNEPFRQRLDNLEKPRDSVCDELLARITELSDNITLINSYIADLDFDKSATVYIPFWISFIANKEDMECHLLGPTTLQTDSEEGSTSSLEGLAISRQVINRLSESNLLHKTMNLPITGYDSENSGNALPVTSEDVKETMANLIEQGIVAKGLGKKTGKYFSGKSVSSTTIHDFLSQRDSMKFFLGDGTEFSDLTREDSTVPTEQNDEEDSETRDRKWYEEFKDGWDEGKRKNRGKVKQYCTNCGGLLAGQAESCISCGQEVRKSE